MMATTTNSSTNVNAFREATEIERVEFGKCSRFYRSCNALASVGSDEMLTQPFLQSATISLVCDATPDYASDASPEATCGQAELASVPVTSATSAS